MKRRRVNFVAAKLFLAATLLAGGCGANGGGAGSEVSVGAARLVIETGGYAPKGPLGITMEKMPGGLASLGDVNGDGYTDLVVASGGRPGSFAAYSGRDGKTLWEVKARTGEGGYTFKGFMMVGDVNADGISDIYAQNAWSRKGFFIFSGRDGTKLARRESFTRFRPLRAEDVTGDGVSDLFFKSERGFYVVSGKDFSPVAEHNTVLPEDKPRARWLMSRYADVNADGVDEYLVGDDTGNVWEMEVLSGTDFAVLGKFSLGKRPYSNNAVFASAGDLNSDGAPDLVMAATQGGGPEHESSFLLAMSGRTGDLLWEVLGTDLPGGPPRFSVDAKTGERRTLPADAGFGDQVVVLPDTDGDSVADIAAALTIALSGKRTTAVLIFSGASGEHVGTMHPKEKQGRLIGSQMVVLESADGKGRPGLAVNGRVAEGKHMVAVFMLPAVR